MAVQFYSFYYDRNKYTVAYTYIGETDTTPPMLPEKQTFRYGETVTISNTSPMLQGYNFSGWTSADIDLSSKSFIMPDKNVSIAGTWIPCTDTPYVVEYYQQNLENDDYTLLDTVNGKGVTGDVIPDVHHEYEGFTETGESIDAEATKIASDGSTVVKLYYDRNSHDVSYRYSGKTDTTPPMIPVKQTFRYGESVTINDTSPVLQGYNFGGWTSADIDLSSKSFIMPDKNVSISGTWIPCTDTPYVVEYYQQNLENNDYALLDRVEGKGVTGDVIPDVHHEYEGFTETEESKKAEATKIASDGSTVVKLYYERNSYYVSYRYAGETDTTPPELQEPGTFRYGETVTASDSNPTLQGYTFDGWKTLDVNVAEGSFIMPSKDVSFIGTWIPRDDTPYTVMYYEQNLENDEYILVDTVIGTGVTGNTIADVHRHYTGFTETDVSKEAGETTIASDGSTVAKRYYDRNSYQVTYEYSGETDTTPPEHPKTATYRYGKTVTIINSNPTLQGYDFGGWKTTDVVVSNDTFAMPAKDVTITGAWYPQDGTPYTVRYYLQNLENSEYSLKDTVNGKGVTGSNIPSIHRDYEGFISTDASIAAEKTKIASDGSTVVNLYYERQSYPVTYKISEQDTTENKYAPKEYKFGSAVLVAVEPEHKDGYPFSGWVTDNATIENGAFTMPSHAVVITGSFRHPSSGKRESTITFKTDGGTKVEPISADTGATVTLNQMTKKTGYCFMGWATRSGGKVVYHVGDKLTVSQNLVLYAVFTKDIYVQGYIDGTFRPDEYLTKREAKLMLSRLNVPSDLSGEDYITTKEFYLAASELGVVPLYDKKERYLTRAEAVTVLNEALEYQVEEVLNPDRKFKDVQLDHWAYSAIMIAAN